MLVLAICCLSLFLVGLDNTIVNIALPAIGKGLHTPVSGLQWTVDGFTLALASLLMFAGSTADRIGRRRVFQVGLAVFSLGSALCGVAPSLGWLVAFRVLQAVGGSMLNPVAVSIISSVFTDRTERERAIGAWVSVFGVSMALGPVIGGVLISSVGWRWIFWVNVPVGLAAIALTALFVPESRAARPRRPDPVGQVLVIVMLGSLTYAIIEGPGTGWRSPEILGLFMLTAVTLGLLVAWELRRTDPLIDPRFFRSLPFAGSAVSAVCTFACLGGFLFLSTLYLQDVRGFSALQAGLRMLPAAAAMAICPFLATRMVTRRGSARVPLVIGGAALTVSSAAMSLLTATSGGGYEFVTFALFGVGIGMVNGQITNAAVAGMPPGQAGVASSIASTSRQVGQALGVAIAGSLLTANLHGPVQTGFIDASHAAWWVLAGCGCAVLALGFATTRGESSRAPASVAPAKVALAKVAPASVAPAPQATEPGQVTGRTPWKELAPAPVASGPPWEELDPRSVTGGPPWEELDPGEISGGPPWGRRL